MPRRLIDVPGAKPLLDIASYARRGPGRRDHLSLDEIELIARTAHRTPEVMIKVLTRGGQDLKAVGRHLAYLSRGGDVEIETDDGQCLSGKGTEDELLEDWDLDLGELCGRGLECWARRTPPKLVHKLIFSMPAGTPPDKVLAAVKTFAREEFGLKHRYAMVLHTDEPHPHVHMVVKSMSEDGVRLNIRKGTLREYRGQFARRLRALGVSANATERAVRGEARAYKTEGIYRADVRGDSTYARAYTDSVVADLRNGTVRVEPGKAKLIQTRREVERGWRAAIDILIAQGQSELAAHARRFLSQMHPPRTERELVVDELRQRGRSIPGRE